MATEEPKIEEILDDAELEDDDDDEMPDLEGVDAADLPADVAAAAEDDGSRQSRAEKKARKALSKLGLKPVENVVRVAIRKSKSILFVIPKPEVLKSPVSDSYVIFGEAKIEDLSQNRMNQAAEKMQPAEAGDVVPPVAETAAEEPAADATAAAEPEEEGEIDEEGVEAKDIELVIAQANVSRAKAVAALKKSGGDIVNAIMELTM
eukprot:TRINITY_DN12341_c6_g2_i1.p1 TRINITY_DN12341_c6_g2~~TRINITY_DN12341_c6_g2_i1.p1  ORF type:complete len:206 (+),score=92.78 TRINITY_DN12341_c6_g2_i1:50-667(+)